MPLLRRSNSSVSGHDSASLDHFDEASERSLDNLEQDYFITVVNNDHDGDAAGQEEEKRRMLLQPFDISTTLQPDKNDLSSTSKTRWFEWSDPWLPSLLITLLLAVPTVLGYMLVYYDLLGRRWIATPWSFHLLLMLVAGRVHLWGVIPHAGALQQGPGFRRMPGDEEEEVQGGDEKALTGNNDDDAPSCAGLSPCRRFIKRLFLLVASLVDIILFGWVYPKLGTYLSGAFFTEIDGTTVIEWSHVKHNLYTLATIGHKVMILRGIVEIVAIFSTCFIFWCSRAPSSGSTTSPRPVRQRPLAATCGWSLLPTWSEGSVRRVQDRLRLGLALSSVSAIILLASCAHSAWIHYWPASVSQQTFSVTPSHALAMGCDPLDETECALPFPSLHYMHRDSSSETGWRVNLPAKLLPRLKSGVSPAMNFVNELDGFSTMGPILFYIEGLKEAHEAGNRQLRGLAEANRQAQLQGHADLAKSVTPQSITLLLDVNASVLVAHSAEIDYLDAKNPLVMIFPAQPLQHNNHYAVAVIKATNSKGQLLAPTPGMRAMFDQSSRLYKSESDRRGRYLRQIFPAFQKAAPWLAFAIEEGSPPPPALQLLFDFVTISESSQLGPVRQVRDGALKHIQNDWNGDWSGRVRVNKLVDTSAECDARGKNVARLVHAELDVPWFLHSFGPGHRGAILDANAVRSSRPKTIGVAKFIVAIPCSARAAALNLTGAKPLRALVEDGHGLFSTRLSATNYMLVQMANEEGYVTVAMDWRGMSTYDKPFVMKMLLSSPGLFQAMRDNVIQGYANKLALQHFAQNGLLSTGWFDFESPETGQIGRVPTLNDEPPVPAFYGNSQGGILGAGYTALMGKTGLLKRSVLIVPGTPFAMIMSRSRDFMQYNKIMLFNFCSGRHVRMYLALFQMGWDSVEGSGALATPVNEPIPPTLMQAGLGDPVVPTLAAEALARAFNASIIRNNPRSDIFNLEQVFPQSQLSSDQSTSAEIDLTPHITFTEILYEKEYSSLPLDNKFAPPNIVHGCVRKDKMMRKQVTEFINSGQVIDPCEKDGCKRESARLYC